MAAVIAPDVGLVFFEVSLKRMLKRNIVGNLETADGGVTIAVNGHSAQTGKWVFESCKRGFRRPGIADVILAAGTERGGKFLAVNEELLIALSPPPVHALGFPLTIPPGRGGLLRLGPFVVDVQMQSAETTASLGQENWPIGPTVMTGRKACSVGVDEHALMPAGVEAEELVGVFAGLDGQAERDALFGIAQIANTDTRALREGHKPAGFERIAIHGQRQRMETVDAGSAAEKITNRREHGGMLAAIPADFQNDTAQHLFGQIGKRSGIEHDIAQCAGFVACPHGLCGAGGNDGFCEDRVGDGVASVIQPPVKLGKRYASLRGKALLIIGHNGPGGEAGIGKMIIAAPIGRELDAAVVAEWDGNEAVAASGETGRKLGKIQRRNLSGRALKPVDEGNVDGRRVLVIEINANVAGLGKRTPDAPNDAGAICFKGNYGAIVQTADVAGAVVVRAPVLIGVRIGIIARTPII